MPTTRNKGATQSQVLPTLPLQAQPPVTSDVPDDVARDQTSQAQQPLQSPASLVTQVMQDLFLNPVFQEQIHTVDQTSRWVGVGFDSRFTFENDGSA